jgi:hypothetical protein
MKSSVIPADAGYPSVIVVIPSGNLDSLAVEESFVSIPQHPLGVKPSGNQYTATINARHAVGLFQILPDEVLAIFLEYLDSYQLRLFGSSCKFLYAFCRSDDLWKNLFIEYVYVLFLSCLDIVYFVAPALYLLSLVEPCKTGTQDKRYT